VAGSVAADGTVSVQLDLASIQTNIDVRNERMSEFLFSEETSATLAATVHMDAMEALGVGAHMIAEVEGELELLGNVVPVYLDMFIMHTTESQVRATHCMCCGFLLAKHDFTTVLFLIQKVHPPIRPHHRAP